MNKSYLIGAVLTALTLATTTTAQAQQADTTKARKEATVVQSKAVVAADKVSRDSLRARKNDHKANGSFQDVQADRKAIRRADRKLMKDQLRKDRDKVKKVL
jgi:hypothetical protein